jgi:hypothetical protein
MEEEKLVQGNTYLIRYGFSGSMSQITVLMVTDMAYQFKYETGTTAWMEKREFERDYYVIENISNFTVKRTTEKFR